MEKITTVMNAVSGLLASIYFLYCVYRYARYGTQPSKMEILVMVMMSL